MKEQGVEMVLYRFILIILFFLPVELYASAQGLNLDWIDKTKSPQEDFYAYANGAWQKSNPIPMEYSSWSNFSILQKSMQDKLNRMMLDLSKNEHLKKGSIEQQIGDFYATGMDAELLNQQGYTKLNPLFESIQTVKTLSDFEALIPKLQMIGVNVLFSFGRMQDYKHSDRMIAAAMQGGLGLPDRDYYLSSDKKMAKIRRLYESHIRATFKLVGESESVSMEYAKAILKIETALAKASLTQVEQRDPYAIYHMMTIKALQNLTPHFSWSNYLEQLHLGAVQSINVGMPDFFKVLDHLLVTVSVDDWKIYARWHVLHAFADYLSDPFVQASFQFDQAFTGAKKLQPRWQRVEATVNNSLDFAVGKYYVEHYFSEKSKLQVSTMISEIRQSFKQTIEHTTWMTEATKRSALKKLDLMTERVGYPEHWRNYNGLIIQRSSFVENVINATAFNNQYDLAKIGQPVDRAEWSMAPQTINAYYDPSMNSITILAGILQPPFFDPSAPAAVNYGAIGFVLGHEMTHGFDDQGALFDGEGNLKNWWTKRDMKQFKAATQCIQDQFSHYQVEPGVSVQGGLVVGEATADLGGILLAYQAFHLSSAYQQARPIDGFTPDQQFFLGVAHVWAGNIRPEQARSLVALDPHPPMKYRVNGPLSNIPAFQEAYHLKKFAPMVYQPRCVIW